MSRKSFTTSAQPAGDGHTLIFLANSGQRMADNGMTVDMRTLLAPVAGDMKLVSELTDDDMPRLTVPLLIDHMPSLTAQAGTITSLGIDDRGLEATARLSDTQAGQLVQQLAADKALSNSFSITIDYNERPDEDGVIKNAELVEISVVYRGADYKAAFTSLNSKKGKTMANDIVDVDMGAVNKTVSKFNLSDDQASALNKAIQDALQGALTKITAAVKDASDDADDGDKKPDDGAPDTPPAGGKEPEPPVQSANSKGHNLMGNTVIINKANRAVNGHAATEHTASFGKNRTSWLDSPKAFDEYAKYVFEHRTEEARDVTEGWNEFAKKQLNEHASYGIDADSVASLIPTSVVQTIEDVFNQPGTLWPMLNHTGIDIPPELGENEVGLDGDDGRAHGYRQSDYGTQKKEENISLATRTFTIDFVYKYLSLHRGYIRKTQNPGALMKYVLSELPNRIKQTCERGVSINDNRVDKDGKPLTDGDWIDLSMFKSVYSDSLEDANAAGARTIPGNRFALTFQALSTMSKIETFRRASGLIRATGSKVLITSPDTAAEIPFDKDANGQFLIPLGSNVEQAITVSQIITPEWWFERDSKKCLGIIMVPSQYALFGDNNISAYTNFALRTNEDEFLQEFMTGGGLRTVKSAVVITNPPTPES